MSLSMPMYTASLVKTIRCHTDKNRFYIAKSAGAILRPRKPEAKSKPPRAESLLGASLGCHRGRLFGANRSESETSLAGMA